MSRKIKEETEEACKRARKKNGRVKRPRRVLIRR